MKIYSILTLFLFTISTSSSHSINYNKNINNQDPIILKHGNHLFLTSEVNEDSKELFINGNILCAMHHVSCIIQTQQQLLIYLYNILSNKYY